MQLSPSLHRRSSMSGAEALLQLHGAPPVLKKRLASPSRGSAGSDTASPSENDSPELKRPRQNPAPTPLRASMQQAAHAPLAPVQPAPVHKPLMPAAPASVGQPLPPPVAAAWRQQRSL